MNDNASYQKQVRASSSSRREDCPPPPASASLTTTAAAAAAASKSKRRTWSSLLDVLAHCGAFCIGGTSSVSETELYCSDDSSRDLSPADGEEQREQLETTTNRQRRRMPCSFVRLCGVVLLLLLALIFGFFRWADPSLKNITSSQTVTQTKDHSPTSATCQQQNPLQALQADSVAEGLRQGAVATDHALCSRMGLEVIRDLGGNAVDAAVTVALCLGVANPSSSGLGGGGFVLVHAERPRRDNDDTTTTTTMPSFDDARSPEDQRAQVTRGVKVTEVIDGREVAPLRATTDMYEDLPDDASRRGALAPAVPGELRALELAHVRYGRLPWSTVVAPVVRLAQRGVPVNHHLADVIQYMADAFSKPENQDFDLGLRALLTRTDDWNDPLREGDLLYNAPLAETLSAVQKEGANAIYTGPRAQRLAQDIQSVGGIISAQDLENYRPVLRSPVVADDVAGYRMVGIPPPSSGGAVVIGAARYLAGFSTPLAATADTLSMHRLVEACKHAFAIRMSLSDPAFHETVVDEAVRDLVEGDYMERLRQTYRDDGILPLSHYGGDKWSQLNDGDGTGEAADAQEGDRRRRRLRGRRFGNLEDSGTSHFSIVDPDGNAVAMTSSVNTEFGSFLLSPSTGILMGNTMDDFSNPGEPNYFGLRPSETNYIKPGKRPLSSMSPTMVFRTNIDNAGGGDKGGAGDLVLVLGASGGPKIISAVLQVFVGHLLMGMPLYQAMVEPRVHNQLIYHDAAVTATENDPLWQGPTITVSQRTRDALERRGHKLLDVSYQGTVQAVAIDPETGELTAASDVRKGGSPAGF